MVSEFLSPDLASLCNSRLIKPLRSILEMDWTSHVVDTLTQTSCQDAAISCCLCWPPCAKCRQFHPLRHSDPKLSSPQIPSGNARPATMLVQTTLSYCSSPASSLGSSWQLSKNGPLRLSLSNSTSPFKSLQQLSTSPSESQIPSYCGLNMQCRQQVYILNAWPLTG